MIDIIVSACTGIGVVFILVWMIRPAFRRSVEFAKYRMLRNERRFSGEEQRDHAQPVL